MTMKSSSHTSSGLTRRRFVSLAAAGAAAAAAPGTIGLGRAATGAAAELQEPKPGGSLRVVFAEEPKNLHPQIDSGTEGVYVQMQVYDSLLNLSPNGDFVPGLATEMPEHPDDLTFIFRLREGVTFHNGEPFTADDVVWTFDRLLGKFPELDSTQAARFAAQIASVEKLDDYIVRFTLKQPWVDFIPLMAGDKYMRIQQKDAELENPEAYGQSVAVGTGPFKFQEWVKGDHLTLVRHEGYWGEPAYVDEVVYRAIPEEATRMNALKAGEIDILLAPALKDLEEFESDPNFGVLAADGGNMKRLAYNTTRAPFDDVKVRQALYYAIDRQEIVEGIYYGYASVGQGILPPWNEAANLDQTYYPHDPEKAQQLLAEAGYDGTALEFEIVTSDATEYVDLSTLIQAQLEQVGVRASILPLDKSAFTERTFAQNGTANPGFQAYVYRLIYGFPTTDYGWRTYHPDSALNASGYNQPGGAQNPEVPPLLDETTRTLDVAKQRELYSRLSDLIMADAPAILIAWQQNVLVSRAAVKDLGITVIHNMPLRQVWLDE
jgi:peptide/nickel transport system substrate-binding protein